MNIRNIAVVIFASLLSCAKPEGVSVTDASVDVSLPVAAATSDPPLEAPRAPTMELHFSPNGGCTDMIVNRIKQAKKKVRLQAYTFTSGPIIQQLIASKNAGVDVQVVLDRSDAGTPGLQQLQTAGVPVKLDKMHVIAHNKVVVIDDRWVLTGSFNFTYAAEHQNAENCLALDNHTLASDYATNWDLHNGHSVAP